MGISPFGSSLKSTGTLPAATCLLSYTAGTDSAYLHMAGAGVLWVGGHLAA